MVEFAFVLPILLALLYGTFVYGYIFVLYQSVNFAAQEGARAAVAAPLNNPSQQNTNAQTVAYNVLSFLPAGQFALVKVNPSQVYEAGIPAIQVQVVMKTTGIFPVLPIPGFSDSGFPPLPATLTATATGLLN